MMGFLRKVLPYRRITVYLEGGAKIKLRADEMTLNHQDGNPVGYNVIDGRGEVPLFINPRKILAVTQRSRRVG